MSSINDEINEFMKKIENEMKAFTLKAAGRQPGLRDEKFYIRTDIEKTEIFKGEFKNANDSMENILVYLSEIPHTYKTRPEYPKSLRVFEKTASDLKILAMRIQIKLLELEINGKLMFSHETTYDSKRDYVKQLNEILRSCDAAIADPVTKEASIVYAVPHKDGAGRYTLENKLTKKRSGAYKELQEIMPLELVPDPIRIHAYNLRDSDELDLGLGLLIDETDWINE